MRNSIILFLAITIFLNVVASSPSCISINGEKVEYFFMRKFPNSTQFIYCDSTYVQCSKPKIASIAFNDTNSSPIMRTIAQINLTDSSIGSVMWNNGVQGQEPIEVNGHTKGVIGFDEEQGFIISHSSPFFPVVENDEIVLELSDDFNFQYGNSYLCLSAPLSQLNKIAQGYSITKPNAYAGQISQNIQGAYNLRNILFNNYFLTDLYTEITFYTTEHQEVKLIAKSPEFNVSFFDVILTQALQTSLLVETGGDQIPASCIQDGKIYNVQSVKTLYLGDVSYFSQQDDNSKYAISYPTNIFCSCDLDRQESQFTRGGAALCFSGNGISQTIDSTIRQLQSCNGEY